MRKDPVKDVVRAGYCTGCGICAAIASPGKISMKFSSGGYLRPEGLAPLNSHEKRIFSHVCPGKTMGHPKQEAPQIRHPIWGPLKSCQTGHATDATLRRQGSSGGVISALGAYLLESQNVDFIAQTVADPTDPIGNKIQASTTKVEILRAAGSRYAPSAPLADLDTLLLTGKRFAFIGKPCDIAALRALAKYDRRINEQIPIMLSFMCAGIPSRNGTLELLERMGASEDALIEFRYRGDGWPGMARAALKDGTARELDYNTSWGQVLNRHLQFRCKVCPDGTGEFADIVCADAWYGENGYPEFEEREGRSLVLCRTEAGEKLIAAAIAANEIDLQETKIEEIEKMQPYQLARKQLVLARLVGALLSQRRIPHFRNMGLWKAASQSRITVLLRNAVGTLKRAKNESA